ncbi:MAG TPA: M23 family metallopeptidase [Anaerolineales bacterium]|nr:M23 family metallopeptidase [Anaerolineales bacterium]
MKKTQPNCRFIRAKFCLFLLIVLLLAGAEGATERAYAYSDTSQRPAFLAWPLPTYIGLARISQFPNTPWTWNYLGLNPEQQCPPAFGYVLDATWWYIWRDKSIPEKQDMARADPHNFEIVNCYSTWGIVGENGHEGTDILAPANTPVYASADGKVAGTLLDYVNSLIVLKHCWNGQWNADSECVGGTEWYTTYMHILPARELLELGKDVPEGTQVGAVYNQGDNSHLHFEVGLDQRMYTNYVNPWGRDAAPWYGCMWKDQSLCVRPNPGYRRMGILTQANRLFIRDDAGNMAEVFEADGIAGFRLAGHRMAVVDRNENLLVKDVGFKRSLPCGYEFLRNWTNLGSNVASYQITDTRVAVLGTDGVFRLKVGDLHGEWDLQIRDVRSFSISEHRLGVLANDGRLLIKEGSLQSDWLTVAGNVRAFQLSDSRIAVLDSAGNFLVQEGLTTAEWKPMGTKVRAFQLAGIRVAIVDENGNLMVNDGNLRAEYVRQARNVQRFQLGDDRILILDKNGNWKIKEGDLYQDWKEVPGFSAQEIFLNGELPVMIK